MKLTKSAATRITGLNQSKVDATRLSPDHSNHVNLVKDIKSEIDKRVRSKKDFTVIIVE